MHVSVDFTTLSLKIGAPSEEFFGILSGPESDERRRLRQMVSHEWAHLLSFLGSPLSDLHRVLVSAQADVMRSILIEFDLSQPNNRMTLPFLATSGDLAPNVCSDTDRQDIEMRLVYRRLLDKIQTFIMGHGHGVERGELLLAFEMFVSIENVNMLGKEVEFISDDIYRFLSRTLQIDPSIGQEQLPILPTVEAEGARLTPEVLSSRSVLEGLAVLGELIHAYRRPTALNAINIRTTLPTAYLLGLKYALAAMCAKRGLDYDYIDLLEGRVPIEIIATMAGIFDLAMQIPVLIDGDGFTCLEASEISVPGSSLRMPASIVELCPAWRLVILCNLFVELNVPFLESAEFTEFKAFHDLQILLCENDILHLDNPETYSISAASTFVTLFSKGGVERASDVYPYLSMLARINRARNEVAYIQQAIKPRGNEWIDFVGFTFPGYMFSPRGPAQPCQDFFTLWDRDYYRLTACVSGSHWDRWWSEWRESRIDDVVFAIRNALGAVCAGEVRHIGAPATESRWIAINSYDYEVRPEYDWGWSR